MTVLKDPLTGALIRLRVVADRPAADLGAVTIAQETGSDEVVVTIGDDIEDGQAVYVVANGRSKRLLPDKRSVSIPLSEFFDGAAPAPVYFVTQVKTGGVLSTPLRHTVSVEASPGSAPEITTAPTVTDAVIGSPSTYTPGVFTNMEVNVPVVEHLVDGVVRAGAVFVAENSDDGAGYSIRVTATNAAGSVSYTTDEVTIVFPAPQLVQDFANLALVEGGSANLQPAPTHFVVFDDDTDATDLEGTIVYSISGTEAEIDPITGVISIGATTVRTDSPVTVTATNSGGSDFGTFNVTVSPAEDLLPFPDPIADDLWQSYEVRDASPAGRRRSLVDASVTVPTGFTLVWYSGRVAWAGDGALANGFYTTITPGSMSTTSGTYAAGLTLYDSIHWRRTEDGTFSPACINQKQYVVQGLYPKPTAIGTLQDRNAIQGGPSIEFPGAVAFYPGTDFEGSTFSITGSGASVDPDTGVVTLVTTDLVDGTVTLTAANVSGSANVAFNYSVVVDPALPDPFPPVLTAAQWEDGEELQETPAGRTWILVDAGVTVPDEFELVWSPTIYEAGRTDWAVPVTPGVQYTTNSTSAVGTVIWSMLFWRRRSDNTFQLASEKRSYTIQGIDLPSPTGLPILPAATVNTAVARDLYRTVYTGSYGMARGPTDEGHSGVVLALRVMAGGASSTVKNRLNAQIDKSLEGGSCPILISGYSQQHDMPHIGMFSLVRNIPEIWNGLSATKRNKIDALMRAAAICGAYSSSDSNPFTAADPPKQIKDFEDKAPGYRRTWAANFRLAFVGMLLTSIPYWGSAQALENYLNGYDSSAHNTLKSDLSSLGLTNTSTVFSKIGTGSAPTLAQVRASVNGYRYYGDRITNYVAILLRESGIMWRHPIKPGWGDDGLGTKTKDRGIRGILISGKNGLPNLNKRAMAQEKNAYDGGASCNNFQRSPRSSMSYAVSGWRVELNYLCALAATGYISSETSSLHSNLSGQTFSAYERIDMGVTDLRYSTDNGWLSTSKGDCSTNKEDWTTSFGENKWYFSMTESLWLDFLKPLLAP